MSAKTGTCWTCSTVLTDYYRGDSCPQCGRDTHVCRNCEFYDPAYNNQCREERADRVVEKERANFCDYFQPSSRSQGKVAPSVDAMRAAAEALFKKK